MSCMDLVSGREAVDLLRASGHKLQPSQGLEILRSGLVGPGQSTRSVTLYERARVQELAAAPAVSPAAAEQVKEVAEGVFVVRVKARRSDASAGRSWMGFDAVADAGRDRSGQDLALRQWWSLGAPQVSRIRDRCRDGFVPMVATVAGVVATGREIEGLELEDGMTSFRLRPEVGSWFGDLFAGRWLTTGPGAPWQWWRPA